VNESNEPEKLTDAENALALAHASNSACMDAWSSRKGDFIAMLLLVDRRTSLEEPLASCV
jgi:hypothetical protein